MNAPAYQPEASARGLAAALKSAAHRLGFTLSGVCRAVEPTGVYRLAEWLDRGYAGQMHYIAARQEAYSHPRHVLNGVRSILVLGHPYSSRHNPCAVAPGHARISRYACGERDYHDVIHDKLRELLAVLHHVAPDAVARGVVDTAPLLEREFAQLAGLGWIGKHTLLLNKSDGSYFFLAALLTDLELEPDEPFTADHCGTCRACLDACPTNAFPQPYVLDATRCISYLTIELRDHIPHDLRPGMGEWLFGCDICQDVCPWNQHAEKSEQGRAGALENSTSTPTPYSQLPTTSALSSTIDLLPLFDLDDDTFRRRFRHTPLWRARRRGILRNAAIVLGNQKHAAAVPTLIRTLVDPEPLIRAAAAWALGQIGDSEALPAIVQSATTEPDEAVRRDLEAARIHLTTDHGPLPDQAASSQSPPRCSAGSG